MIEFSTPILSVSSEVVKDLDGEDALYGMWAVFTKCKQSLKDGRRLENMSWRLWYREMSLSYSPDSFTSRTFSPSLSDAGCTSPITPVSENGPTHDFFAISDDSSELLLPVPQGPSLHTWGYGRGVQPPPSNIRRLSTASMPARPGTRLQPQQRAGGIIMHILPEKIVYPSPTASRRTYRSRKQPAPVSTPSTAKPSPVQSSAASTSENSSMPRPATSVLQPRPTIALPTFHLPSTPPTFAAPPVVVVSPTPHPTPPATPHPSNSPEKASPYPERPQTESRKSLHLQEPSPASTTSSNAKSEVPPAPPRRTQSRTTIRRGKDVPRFTTAKMTGKVQRPTSTRKQTESKKSTFNVRSASSNGTKSNGHGQHLPKAPSVEQLEHRQHPAQQHFKPASLPKKKAMSISASSDYSTESDNDSVWASDANSPDEEEKERKKSESKVRDAAQEAQRQLDMFSKLPKRSYTDLTQRTRSGLLSQLMNPNPAIFPDNHPYRQSHSTVDMTQFDRQHGARLPPPGYQTSRSSAAMPLALAAQITPMNVQALSTNGAGASGTTAYRPKGRPQGEELETDTEEEDGTDNGLQLSVSLAQQKLAALAAPGRRLPQEPAANGPSGLARSKVAAQQQGSTIPSIATPPIPLHHPYNLSAPTPLMTPQTTRRQMLSTELSESMRRNLLWERHVSKRQARGGGVFGQRLQPLTETHPQGKGEGQDGQHMDEREEQRHAAVAKNRLWADDFHSAGW